MLKSSASLLESDPRFRDLASRDAVTGTLRPMRIEDLYEDEILLGHRHETGRRGVEQLQQLGEVRCQKRWSDNARRSVSARAVRRGSPISSGSRHRPKSFTVSVLRVLYRRFSR
jgi:hypothetical protein